jgi:hypothetical protein
MDIRTSIRRPQLSVVRCTATYDNYGNKGTRRKFPGPSGMLSPSPKSSDSRTSGRIRSALFKMIQLDRVYSKAALTIVATAGTSADAGLPGVCEGSRVVQRNCAEIKGLKLIVPLPYIYGTVDYSEWNSRGRTC